jgi:hypothetical protein
MYAGVLYHLFAKLAETKFRSRNPTQEEWKVAETIHEVLTYPCKIVVQSQLRGHWLLSCGIRRLVDVYTTYKSMCERMEDMEEETALETDDDPFLADLRALRSAMQGEIVQRLKPFISPLQEFSERQAHMGLAIMLDPRFASCKMFIDVAEGSTEAERVKNGQALFVRYRDAVLIPMMISAFVRINGEVLPADVTAQRRMAADPMAAVTETRDEICTTFTRATLVDQMLNEFVRFREVVVSMESIDKWTGDDVLLWWKNKGSKQFANLAVVARAVFSIPASQIECERVFYVAGQFASVLRNRMGVDCLDMLVFLYKNVDQKKLMEEIIRAAHGDHTAMDHDIIAACKPQDECAALDAVMLATEGVCTNTYCIAFTVYNFVCVIQHVQVYPALNTCVCYTLEYTIRIARLQEY